MSNSSNPKLDQFAEKIGIKFNNIETLKEALTHRSFVNENRDEPSKQNERLEFLGDAVLELITTEFLYQKYPDRPEGDLTSFRAALVRTESIADAAAKLGFGEYLFMSRGEEATGGRSRQYILANAFEAVLGAIYLDQGFQTCVDFVSAHILPNIEEIVTNRLDIDPKSKLQEVAQEIIRFTPMYELVSETGPDHDKEFEMRVLINGFEFATGKGHSKQEAEQSAARAALTNWQKLYQKYQDFAKITPTRPK